MVKRLDVRLASPGVEIRTLSGGNQQKVLIGRALAIEPRILLLDEPTRGVDIGAKQEIYAAIERLVAGGMAVMLISSDLEEVLRLSDQIVSSVAGGSPRRSHEPKPRRLRSCEPRPCGLTRHRARRNRHRANVAAPWRARRTDPACHCRVVPVASLPTVPNLMNVLRRCRSWAFSRSE
jgi:energy-coupling factor transporter ATP-binding protein EcfA2